MKNLYKLQSIRRQNRKIGRNESCPCGRTKEVDIVANKAQEMILNGSGDPIETFKGSVRVKYKHCHGNEVNQRKMKFVKDKINQYFYDLTHNKPKKAKLAVIVDCLKKAFNNKMFGRK